MEASIPSVRITPLELSPFISIQTMSLPRLKEIEKAGGTILVPEMEIPNTGKFGLFLDPQGNKIGLFKPFPNGVRLFHGLRVG